jgi:phosphoserine aminotransferase
VAAWVERTPWVEFLAGTPALRSPTSVCLAITDPAFTALSEDGQQAFVKDLTKLLADERAAYDVQSYRDAPAGLRIWCGATVETGDVEALLPWLDWAFARTRQRLR